MAKNITGIAISIKSFLPIGATLDSQLEALTMVKDAHSSGDYGALLSAAKVEEVKTEQKTRRMDEPATETVEPKSELVEAFEAVEPVGPIDEPEDVPKFLKAAKAGAA